MPRQSSQTSQALGLISQWPSIRVEVSTQCGVHRHAPSASRCSSPRCDASPLIPLDHSPRTQLDDRSNGSRNLSFCLCFHLGLRDQRTSEVTFGYKIGATVLSQPAYGTATCSKLDPKSRNCGTCKSCLSSTLLDRRNPNGNTLPTKSHITPRLPPSSRTLTTSTLASHRQPSLEGVAPSPR